MSFFISYFNTAQSQDLEKIKDAKPLTVAGGIGASTGWYGFHGMETRRDPLTWSINANLDFNIYGVFDIPFSLIITKGDRVLNRPVYSHYGISPKYKFITAHLGYRSMNFSSYSYSGLTFLGGGVEVKPEKSIFSFSFMYGRFNEAIPVNFATGDVTNVAYARYGWGTMIGIGKSKHHVDLILFKAKDDTSSVHLNPDSINKVKPQENLVMGIITNNQIGDNINLKLEYTTSYLSTDITSPARKFSGFCIANYLKGLFTPRFSTSIKNAITGGLNYQGKGYSFGVAYKWIDPEYKSLGTSYSENDVEDWTVNATKSLISNKLNISGSIGTQRNNLANNLKNTSRRNIYSLNSSFAVNQNLNFGLTYSNFSSSNAPSVVDMNDSIKYIQTTTNKGINVNYSKGLEKTNHNISFCFNMQNANTLNQNGTEAVSNNTTVTSGTLSYSITLIPIELSINSAVNYSKFKQDSVQSLTVGPTLGASRSFFNKKINTNLSFSFLRQDNGLNSNSNVTVLNFSVSYSFLKNHSLSLNNAVSFNNSRDTSGKKKSSELVGSIRYSYNFSK